MRTVKSQIRAINEALKNWRAYRQYLDQRLRKAATDPHAYVVDGQLSREDDFTATLIAEREDAKKRVEMLTQQLVLLFVIYYLGRGWPFDSRFPSPVNPPFQTRRP